MKIITLVMAFTLSFASFAKCIVHYNRTACPGEEKISYKKCDNKKECDREKHATTLEKCRKKAMHSCKNKRYHITKLKVITATFNGKAITTKSGKSDFCLEYKHKDTEFNQCKK